MDVLDSPLNVAHQRGRRAEMLVSAGRFDEAVECHKQAADFIAEAMAKTQVESAIESLRLQRERHMKQEVIIRNKQRQLAILQKKQDKGESKPPSNTPSQSDLACQSSIPNPLDSANSCQIPDGGVVGASSPVQEPCGVYQTMDDCDSLLRFLNNRAAMHGREVEQPESIQTQTSSSGFKRPKAEKEIIEELRLHNDALRAHVLELLRENEDQYRQLDEYQRHLDIFKCENDDLKSRLGPIETHSLAAVEEEEVNYSPFPAGLDLHKLPNIELPPLEVPKFDFSVLKTGSSQTSDQID